MAKANFEQHASDFDRLCLRVKETISDAMLISVGREMSCDGLDFAWAIRFHMPKRDRSHRLMRGRTEVVLAGGVTFADALEDAISQAHYYRCGKILDHVEA